VKPKGQNVWNTSPFLHDDGVLLAAYIDRNRNATPTFATTLLDSHITLLSDSKANATFVSWKDDDGVRKFGRLRPGDGSRSNSTETQSTDVVAVGLDTILFRDIKLTGCSETELGGGIHCYIGLRIGPKADCLLSSDITDDPHTGSWSCYVAGNRPGNKCVDIVSGSTLDSMETQAMKFCGDPVRNLLALDGQRKRLFFVQCPTTPEEANYQTRAMVKTSTSVTHTSDELLVENDTMEWPSVSYNETRNYNPCCVSYFDMDPYYRDVSQCIPLAIDKTPTYMSFDDKTSTLAIFSFSNKTYCNIDVFDTVPTLSLKTLKFRVRLENWISGWVLSSTVSSYGSLMLLGNQDPFAGILTVIDLEKGTWSNVEPPRQSASFV